MTLAHSSEGDGLAAAFHDAGLRRGGVHLAFGAADGDFGAAFRVAGFAGGSVRCKDEREAGVSDLQIGFSCMIRVK
jgi:hypothetical protein